jgi:hypothetical protein
MNIDIEQAVDEIFTDQSDNPLEPTASIIDSEFPWKG